MKYEYFLKLILTYKKASEDLSELHDIGVDLFEGKFKISNHLYSMLQYSIEERYGDEGWDMLEWFIFESEYGTKPDFTAEDKNKNIICHSYLSMWDYLQKLLTPLP
jgi:hypothetical protein